MITLIAALRAYFDADDAMRAHYRASASSPIWCSMEWSKMSRELGEQHARALADLRAAVAAFRAPVAAADVAHGWIVANILPEHTRPEMIDELAREIEAYALRIIGSNAPESTPTFRDELERDAAFKAGRLTYEQAYGIEPAPSAPSALADRVRGLLRDVFEIEDGTVVAVDWAAARAAVARVDSIAAALDRTPCARCLGPGADVSLHAGCLEKIRVGAKVQGRGDGRAIEAARVEAQRAALVAIIALDSIKCAPLAPCEGPCTTATSALLPIANPLPHEDEDFDPVVVLARLDRTTP